MGEDTIKRKLRVASTEIIGRTKKGSAIYRVYAVTEEGAQFEEELRTFEELPLGRFAEYTLKKYRSQKYGDSWTMYPPKGTQPQDQAPPPERDGGSTELTTKVASLEERVEALEQALRLRESAEALGGEPPPF